MPTVNEKIGQYGKELIDYEAIVKNYPWIIHEKMNCILSPDSDGLLCGLLMGHVFDWSVKGFYDGKILVVEKGVDIQRCVFLDMEILRRGFAVWDITCCSTTKETSQLNWMHQRTAFRSTQSENMTRSTTLRSSTHLQRFICYWA